MDVMNPEQARIAEKAGAVAGAEDLKISGDQKLSVTIPYVHSHGIGAYSG